MTETASLWVSHPQLMFERVGGLTVLERQLWTIQRAGFTRAWIATPQPDAKAMRSLRLPKGLALTWSRSSGLAGGAENCDPPYIGVSGDHFIRVELLGHIRTTPYGKHVAFTDEDDNTIVQTIPFRTDKTIAPEKQPLPPGGSIPLASPVAAGPAMDWACATGFKPQDGFMARNFDRYISLAISRLLLNTPISANLMTLLSGLVGLAGAACFLRPGLGLAMTGACLIWLHSVLDGCDGELARIRFQESTLGSDIDFWTDNLVHICLFAALGLGLFRSNGAISLILGGSAIAGVVGSAVIAFRQRLARRRAPQSAVKSAEPGGLLSRIETILVQRDFIYLLLVMAYFDMTFLFLWAGAIGAPLFMLLMIIVTNSSEEAAVETAG